MCLKQGMKTILGSCTDQMCTLERRVIYSHRMKRKSPGLRAAWHASVQYNSASNDGICKQKTFLGLNIILLPHPTQKPQMIFEKNSPLSFVKLTVVLLPSRT